MSLIKVVQYVLVVTPWVPGAPEPRMYPRSGYFLVILEMKDFKFLDVSLGSDFCFFFTNTVSASSTTVVINYFFGLEI